MGSSYFFVVSVVLVVVYVCLLAVAHASLKFIVHGHENHIVSYIHKTTVQVYGKTSHIKHIWRSLTSHKVLFSAELHQEFDSLQAATQTI